MYEPFQLKKFEKAGTVELGDKGLFGHPEIVP